jgi:hypothetical protein
MVNLYVWRPLPLLEALDHKVIPDLGHAALEVVDGDGRPLVYASFWPEIDTPVGELLRPFKPRAERHPASYADESDPAQGYMQRHAENLEHLKGLDEAVILREWPQIRDANYDLTSWNCSNVCKLLIFRAMKSEQAETIAQMLTVPPEEMAQIYGGEDFMSVLSYLTTRTFVDCRPDDILRLARAYRTLFDPEEAEMADEITRMERMAQAAAGPATREALDATAPTGG